MEKPVDFRVEIPLASIQSCLTSPYLKTSISHPLFPPSALTTNIDSIVRVEAQVSCRETVDFLIDVISDQVYLSYLDTVSIPCAVQSVVSALFAGMRPLCGCAEIWDANRETRIAPCEPPLVPLDNRSVGAVPIVAYARKLTPIKELMTPPTLLCVSDESISDEEASIKFPSTRIDTTGSKVICTIPDEVPSCVAETVSTTRDSLGDGKGRQLLAPLERERRTPTRVPLRRKETLVNLMPQFFGQRVPSCERLSAPFGLHENPPVSNKSKGKLRLASIPGAICGISACETEVVTPLPPQPNSPGNSPTRQKQWLKGEQPLRIGIRKFCKAKHTVSNSKEDFADVLRSSDTLIKDMSVEDEHDLMPMIVSPLTPTPGVSYKSLRHNVESPFCTKT